MLIPPRAIGETFTFAVGQRTRCHPSAVFGFGGEANGLSIVTSVWEAYLSRTVACEETSSFTGWSFLLVLSHAEVQEPRDRA